MQFSTLLYKSFHDNILRWMPQDLTDDKSTLVQVMAWCSQSTSHYLNQCWPRYPTPYGVTRPQWVNTLRTSQTCRLFAQYILKCISFNQNCWILIKKMFHFLYYNSFLFWFFSQNLDRHWHQAITWTNVDWDLRRIMASLGHKESTLKSWSYFYTYIDISTSIFVLKRSKRGA